MVLRNDKGRGKMTREWNVIHVYTRAQAIADGTLVDATHTAKGIGFRVPVAFTAAAWGRCISVASRGQCVPDEYGRLVNALWALRRGIAETGGKAGELRFTVQCRPGPGHPTESVELKALCGPGDNAEPVLTVLMPDED
jgi:hypothetical protein